ncbi:hypothetical protein HMPREF9124_2227 [Oribacterium sp. oral taxon 108 str. F0425]|nr:hypothetical protein HMPREF9124_2227 [Oribacterium sp. oral taxon 108 str. F0425]
MQFFIAMQVRGGVSENAPRCGPVLHKGAFWQPLSFYKIRKRIKKIVAGFCLLSYIVLKKRKRGLLF